jgi:hypothetical protein
LNFHTSTTLNTNLKSPKLANIHSPVFNFQSIQSGKSFYRSFHSSQNPHSFRFQSFASNFNQQEKTPFPLSISRISLSKE